YTECYDREKLSYEATGKALTGIFDDLKSLYFHVKALEKTDFTLEIGRLSELQARIHATSVSKQLAFSNWYAHYTFFCEQQLQWVDEQLHFKFWRDKVPLSLTISAVLALSGAIYLSRRYFMCRSF